MKQDLHPEQVRYQDTGCDVAPACLSCHLPQCKYDDPGSQRKEDLRRRNELLVEGRRNGVSVKQLARRYDMSERTVARVIQLAQKS